MNAFLTKRLLLLISMCVNAIYAKKWILLEIIKYYLTELKCLVKILAFYFYFIYILMYGKEMLVNRRWIAGWQ